MKKLPCLLSCNPRWIASALLFTLFCGPIAAAEIAPPAPPPATAPEADAAGAWAGVSKLTMVSPQPAEWQTKPPTQEQYRVWMDTEVERLKKAASQAGDFAKRFPKNENAARAAEMEFQFLNRAAMMGDKEASAQRDAGLEAKLKDPTLPAAQREKLRIQQIMNQVREAARGSAEERRQAYENGGRTLLKEFPENPDAGYGLLFSAAGQLEPEASRPLAKEIVESKASPELKARAEGLLRRLDALGKPLDIKFTALDGREVDVQSMKGKVVLIDFWATWCGPCVAELPKIKAAYEKLHPRGFEIVGLSFDSERGKLESFVKERDLPWAQYFDGLGWKNKYGVQFAINGIPTMWLVDKQGLLRDVGARSDLETKIEKLLAE
jgi:thiol-disulfide isomerase/thioredoxin